MLQFLNIQFENLDQLQDHILQAMSWACGICIHHTAYPNLSMRPDGLTRQHIFNINHFYVQKGWDRGPHLFVDDQTPYHLTSNLGVRGIHARAFNNTHIGIEMLGNFDINEDFSDNKDRALRVIENTAKLVAFILDTLSIELTTKSLVFHRDDPSTSKTCPGSAVAYDLFYETVEGFMESPEEEASETPVLVDSRITETLGAINWQSDQIMHGNPTAKDLEDRIANIKWLANEL